MTVLNSPRPGALILSRGAVLDNFWPAIADDFPDGSTTSIVFFDSTSAEIAEVAGTVTSKKLTYLVQPDDLDPVPNGAQYELWLTTPDGPYKVEYGHVIRREASFYQPLPTSLEADVRLFTDLLNRDALGRRWVGIQGGVKMWPLADEQFAMGPDIGLLFAEAGARYFRPFAGDSFRVRFGIYAVIDSGIGTGGAGKLRFHGASDVSMHTGMSFEIQTDTDVFPANRKLHTGIVTAPTDITYTGSAVTYEAVTGDEFLVEYSNISRTMQVFLNDDTDPIIAWTDDDAVLPHGLGYRYWGFSWASSLVATGPLLVTVEAQDYV